MREQLIMREIQGALNRRGGEVRVWRNSTGCLRNERGVPVRFGLAVGSADLVGVGPGGRFVALEVKTATGRATAEQQAWLDAVRRLGGFAAVVRSVDEALEAIERCRKGEQQ